MTDHELSLDTTTCTLSTGTHAPNCGKPLGTHAPNIHRLNALTCANVTLGHMGHITRKPPSRARVHARAAKVSDQLSQVSQRARNEDR